MTKVTILLYLLLQGQPPITESAEMPTVEACLERAAKLMANPPKSEHVAAYAVGCRVDVVPGKDA